MIYSDKISLVSDKLGSCVDLIGEIDNFINTNALPYAIKCYWRKKEPYMEYKIVLELTVLTLNKILNNKLNG